MHKYLILGCSLFAIGCGDSTPMGADLSGGDMAMGADLKMGGGPDIAMGPDMVMPADMASFTGQITVAELATTILVQGQPVGVKVISPSASFGALVGPPHDYDPNPMALVGVCRADHYDVGKGDLPPPSMDDGTVNITGYTGGMTLTMMPLPNEINCILGMTGQYKCGLGPLNNGMPGPDPAGAALAGNAAGPIAKGDALTFKAGPKGPFGTLNAKGSPAIDTVSTAENLNALVYDPTKDLVLTTNCLDDPKCPGSVLAVTAFADQNPPAMNGQASATFGAMTCTFQGAGMVTVEKAAVAALLGCDMNGANCDGALKSVRTAVVRIPIGAALPAKDSNMIGIRLVTARGAVGAAAH
jgi:hypothetical protein